MPYVEVLAPALPAEARARVARHVTEGICDAFSVGPQTVTIYFLDVAATHYAHAGIHGAGGAGERPQRIFVKVHAYRRGVEERRRAALALTAPLADAYGVPAATLAVYFFDRFRDEVAHGGQLSCDADPA